MLTCERAKTLLRGILIFNGLLTLLALPAVFLPTDTMATIHEQLHIGPFPNGAIVQYLARSASALYAAFGSLTLVVVWDIKRFAPLVTWWGTTAIVFGCILFWVDHVAGMPTHWTWGEGPYLLATGGLVLLLQFKTGRTDASAAEPQEQERGEK